MLGGIWVAALVVALLISAFVHAGELFFFTLLLLIVTLSARLWQRYCLDGIEYRRRLSHPRVFFGEEVELECEIVNRKLLPLAWLQIDDDIPRVLRPRHGRVTTTQKADRLFLTHVVPLRPYERVRRHFTIRCTVRGEHQLGPVTMRSGDPFGMLQRTEEVERLDTLLVYPRIVPLERLGLPARQPLGDIRQQSWLFEDLSRVAGVRDYTPRDDLRRVHWAATARSQQIQVKVFEATTSYKFCLFLNLHTSGDAWWRMVYDAEALELMVMTAASIAQWAVDRGLQIGLYANSAARGGASVAVPPASDPGQLEDVLASLARVQSFAHSPIEALLKQYGTRLAFGTTVAIITSPCSAELIRAAQALHRRGHPVIVVIVGEARPAASTEGLTVRRVSAAPEEWETVPAVAVV